MLKTKFDKLIYKNSKKITLKLSDVGPFYTMGELQSYDIKLFSSTKEVNFYLESLNNHKKYVIIEGRLNESGIIKNLNLILNGNFNFTDITLNINTVENIKL
jgi:hypothetical protein